MGGGGSIVLKMGGGGSIVLKYRRDLEIRPRGYT